MVGAARRDHCELRVEGPIHDHRTTTAACDDDDDDDDDDERRRP
jgi:hypothetical protein